TRCNALLPLCGPATLDNAYAEAAELLAHDVRALLLRLASGASFSDDCAGGGRHSNLRLLLPLLQLACLSLDDAPFAAAARLGVGGGGAGSRVALERTLTALLVAPTIGGAGSAGGPAEYAGFACVLSLLLLGKERWEECRLVLLRALLRRAGQPEAWDLLALSAPPGAQPSAVGAAGGGGGALAPPTATAFAMELLPLAAAGAASSRAFAGGGGGGGAPVVGAGAAGGEGADEGAGELLALCRTQLRYFWLVGRLHALLATDPAANGPPRPQLLGRLLRANLLPLLEQTEGLLAELDSSIGAASSLYAAFDALGVLPAVLLEAQSLPAPPAAAANPSAETLVARWTRQARAPADGAAAGGAS
ncbi:E3 ubiquitin-protein ligase UBR4-domain-containing protein, partial [Pavlovales sp. CCMP2436]